ncbi:hypothetical protein I899_gp092 [Pelagibacter phage HTVC008M]|uniref:hypothetical protein n=1 Tax=Pelagibacter phage HTVC008M TaxID=1283076 RepID=UPI0002B27EDA|nr:hypothetical protein I899_gp092 [Pelagibacter phage HTVC008M]AGE60426.1 hypothetical protein [Pelagibacter phage HTVC008M]
MKILVQYFWITIISLIILAFAMMIPTSKDPLPLEEKMDEIREKEKVLTDTEKELKKLSDDKAWEEVDDTTTIIVPLPKPEIGIRG